MNKHRQPRLRQHQEMHFSPSPIRKYAYNPRGNAPIPSYPDEDPLWSTILLESCGMRKIVISGLILILAGVILYLATQGVQKTVTLHLNGVQSEHQTFAWTVSEFLEEQGIPFTGEESLEPSPTSLLIGNTDIFLQQTFWVTILNNGITKSLYTQKISLDEILSEFDIQISADDHLYLDGALATGNESLTQGSNHTFQIINASPVAVKRGNNSLSLVTTAPTLGQAFWEDGITLDAGDSLVPPADSIVDGPIDAVLEESKSITIQYAGGSLASKTTARTVGGALSESGIALQGLDYSRPAIDAPLPENGNLQVIRVREEQYLESEPIPYETETQPSADLEIDQRSVIQPGVLGLLSKRIRIRYEDNQEISRLVEDEYVSQPPQSEIIGYGTKIVPHTLDTPRGQITYWRVLDMYAVSYNVTSNGGYGTATGIPLAKGVAAIDPNYIPYGTRMYVPGYGEALAADTGGGINGRMIDLGYTDEDYVSWHQWVKVYFLWPPPENVAWIIP